MLFFDRIDQQRKLVAGIVRQVLLKALAVIMGIGAARGKHADQLAALALLAHGDQLTEGDV